MEVFKTKPTKQKYVIISFVIAGIVLLGAVIRAVVGVISSQKCKLAFFLFKKN